MRFTVKGNPIAKARPRFSMRGRFMRAYDSQDKQKRRVMSELKRAYKDAINSQNKQMAVEASKLASAEFFVVDIQFYFPCCNSSSTAQRNAKLWGLQKCTSKPDLDNLEKFYLDCFNGVLFSDDSLVIKLSSEKKYSKNPRVEIEIVPKEYMLSDDVNGILEIFGPDDLTNFLRITWELYDLYGREEDGDWVEDEVGIENVDEVRLARTAYILSALADLISKPLVKINRRYPGFHKLAERLAFTQAIQEKLPRAQNV